MVVGNACGFDFAVRYVNESKFDFAANGIQYDGGTAVIPFDRIAHLVPDDFGFYQELRVLVPPAPVLEESVVKVDDEVLEKAVVNKNKPKKKPLKGVKIKKRAQILKDTAYRNGYGA